MTLSSNKIHKKFWKIKLKDYINNFLSENSKLLVFRYIFKYLHNFKNMYKADAGDYCESVIPDPIPNSEVKPLCADGTLS